MTFEEFVEARLQALLRYAVMLTGDPHTAQDLLQETMIRAQLKWRRIAAASVPEHYVKRMLTNAYIDLHRGSWLRRVVLRAELSEPVGPPSSGHGSFGLERSPITPRRPRTATRCGSGWAGCPAANAPRWCCGITRA